MLEEETRQKEELRDALAGADRRVQAAQGELDEIRALLEQVSTRSIFVKRPDTNSFKKSLHTDYSTVTLASQLIQFICKCNILYRLNGRKRTLRPSAPNSTRASRNSRSSSRRPPHRSVRFFEFSYILLRLARSALQLSVPMTEFFI